MDVLEEVKKRFPQYQVTSRPCSFFPDSILIGISAEEGEKYNPDGFPNPKYNWYQWWFDIGKEGTDLTKILDVLETEIASRTECSYIVHISRAQRGL